MHDDDFDDELDNDVAELSEPDENAHTLSIRRADGREIVTISTLGSGQQWAVYMQPGGKVQNVYLGDPGDPSVWVEADEYDITRDADGTYVVTVD
ncbi:hypothetical protein [Mycobacterium sp.]|uniref:hypothetical protein n=1 Tax=Mycobacterium sp. TaxID=1785 RepID=UPI0025DDDA31|nr:hypothetical protein [Mycobacterium sp.]